MQTNTIISIHNYPTNIPPSGSDFAWAGYRRYIKGVVVCHNGDVYVYEPGNRPFSAKLKSIKRMDNKGIEANLKTIKQFEKTMELSRGDYEI